MPCRTERPRQISETQGKRVMSPFSAILVKLIKTGAKVVRHSKYVTFQLAEVAGPRKVFAAILARLRRWAAKARAGPLTMAT